MKKSNIAVSTAVKYHDCQIVDSLADYMIIYVQQGDRKFKIIETRLYTFKQCKKWPISSRLSPKSSEFFRLLFDSIFVIYLTSTKHALTTVFMKLTHTGNGNELCGHIYSDLVVLQSE